MMWCTPEDKVTAPVVVLAYVGVSARVVAFGSKPRVQPPGVLLVNEAVHALGVPLSATYSLAEEEEDKSSSPST